MHMHMRLQYGTPYYMHMHTCASNTIALTMAFPSLHTNSWEHNYMDLAHNTAQLVCCEYKERGNNTCIGAACTSSIELTCSCACGWMAITCTCAYNTATTYSLLHAHALLLAISSRICTMHNTLSCMFQYRNKPE
jgi:hypothetical protein